MQQVIGEDKDDLAENTKLTAYASQFDLNVKEDVWKRITDHASSESVYKR
jgi:hypothetical protein